MIETFLRFIRSKPFAGMLLLSAIPPCFGTTPLQDLQTTATTWANLRSELNRLETYWTTEKKVLTASLSGLSQRAEQLALQQEILVASTAKDRREIDELRTENNRRTETLAQVDTRMVIVTQKLLALRPSLPPRLSIALELPYRSLNTPNLAAGERAQHVMTILNRCHQFNQAFVFAEEIIPTQPGADPQLLEIIYLGLAQACAIDRAADQAYVGRPVDGNWTWTQTPDLAGEITRLIAIYQDRTEPTFISVPLQVTGGAK
jgi:hypothetical protein